MSQSAPSSRRAASTSSFQMARAASAVMTSAPPACWAVAVSAKNTKLSSRVTAGVEPTVPSTTRTRSPNSLPLATTISHVMTSASPSVAPPWASTSAAGVLLEPASQPRLPSPAPAAAASGAYAVPSRVANAPTLSTTSERMRAFRSVCPGTSVHLASTAGAESRMR
ncbi:hypothetical protein ACFPRL_12320 [Pseudoclavibacter helvolus]